MQPLGPLTSLAIAENLDRVSEAFIVTGIIFRKKVVLLGGNGVVSELIYTGVKAQLGN